MAGATNNEAFDGMRMFNEMYGPLFRVYNELQKEIMRNANKILQQLKQNHQQNQQQQNTYWVNTTLDQLKKETDFETNKMIVATKSGELANDTIKKVNALSMAIRTAIDENDYDTAAMGLACVEQIRNELQKDNQEKNYEHTQAKVDCIIDNSPIAKQLQQKQEQEKVKTQEKSKVASTSKQSKSNSLEARFTEAKEKAKEFNANIVKTPKQAVKNALTQDIERVLTK